MAAFARISANLPGLTGEFDYSVPELLSGQVRIGCLVQIPFGKQTVQGVVMDLPDRASVAETKAILELVDPEPVLTGAQIALARWMAETSLNPLSAMIDLMVPAGLNQHADTIYSLREGMPASGRDQTSPVASRLVHLLQEKGPLRGRQIDRHFSKVDWRRNAQVLIRSGILSSRSVLPPVAVRPKYVRTAQLAVPPQAAEDSLDGLGRSGAVLARRQAALRYLMNEPGEVNVAWVYAASACNISDLQELAERQLILLRESEVWRDPLAKIEPSPRMQGLPLQDSMPELTLEQQKALESIEAAFSMNTSPKPFLLQGITGSGKTEIYLQATAEAIRNGKQAIILVPEIAITPQTVRRFMVRFPGQVGLVHSRLSAGERYDTWRRARQGSLKVIIGPRSALFTPLANIGLIAADECHDPSYHQSDPPFYSAITAAQEYARLYGAVCILGSATPSIAQRFQADSGKSTLLELSRRISNPDLPQVQVVDMREELKSGERSLFSRPLLEALENTLRQKEQAILFLNRRGTATYVFCRECGAALRCPQCDTPLTLHMDDAAQLRCHTCGYTRQVPKNCPTCKGTQIRAYGLGSEKVEAELNRVFPDARSLRWDWETTRQKDSHEIILSHFAAHRADVLIGTQMIAKGLDLPLVTLVGIVLADVGLNLPDPFAAERTFNLLIQVSGRAGRSGRGGRVILQTFQPESPVIREAALHDVKGFYQRELEERRRLGYPPFSRLIRLEYRHPDARKAEATARIMSERIQGWMDEDNRVQTSRIGPVPSFFSRIAGDYRWQIVLRGPDPASLLRGRDLKGWRVEVDPITLL